MSHSIAQELVMTRGMTLEEAEAKVSEMREQVANEDTDAAEILFENGLDDDNGAWLAELSE